MLRLYKILWLRVANTIEPKLNVLAYKVWLVILILLSMANRTDAQMYNEYETGFSTIFSTQNNLDSYYYGNNPAFQNFTKEDEFLSLKNITKNDEGDFKKFTSPNTDRSIGFFTSGKKLIDSLQRFKGSFGFTKLERKNWEWFFTRDYQTDNPFILGDSTTGNSRINGILLNAQYSINISDDFLAGINLDYTVDEGLKTVSPRPTSEHRDIGARIGIGYKVNKEFSVGIMVDISDKNEQISFREDEGALTQETIILKFKGYDLPNVLRKKVETRYSFTNQYLSGLTFSYNGSNNLLFAGFLNSGFDKNSIKDDALDPKEEGFWKDDFLAGGLKVKYQLAEGYISGFEYRYENRDGWAKYPPTDVLYYERKNYSHSLSAGVERTLSSELTVGIEGGMSFSSINENDHYSIVKVSTKSTQGFGKVGVDFTCSENISTLLSYGFSQTTHYDNNLQYFGISPYFTNYRIYDLLYKETGFVKHNLAMISVISYSQTSTFLFQINYSFIKPKSGSLFSGRNRNELELTLEYRAKVI